MSVNEIWEQNKTPNVIHSDRCVCACVRENEREGAEQRDAKPKSMWFIQVNCRPLVSVSRHFADWRNFGCCRWRDRYETSQLPHSSAPPAHPQQRSERWSRWALTATAVHLHFWWVLENINAWDRHGDASKTNKKWQIGLKCLAAAC